jgi:putative ABC transport system permease protein
MSVEVLNIMNLSGLLIGLAVTALTLYINTLNKRQEYGVLKAMGAKNRHLYTVVIAQAFLSLGIGFGLAVGLVWLLERGLPLLIPNVTLMLTVQSMVRLSLASLFIGIIAALAPAWQMAQLDPAQVFRG